MGPIALFDKSFLQSLSLDESVLFDHFFFPVICPLFYIETLADLEKDVKGRTAEDEVRIIASKVPEMSGGICAYHGDLAFLDLLHNSIPMDGHIPPSSLGTPVKVDGQIAVVHDVAPEAEAFSRWQRREFLYVERHFAKRWRDALNKVDLEGMAAAIPEAQQCETLADAKQIAESFVRRPGTAAVDQIRLAISVVDAPPEFDFHIFGRWASGSRAAIQIFAPYAAHVVAVELFFRLAVRAGLIGAGRVSNRMDIAYLFYLPFCQVFVSSDALHRRTAALFSRDDQSFVWGPSLKSELGTLVKHYVDTPEEQKERGLMGRSFRLPPELGEGVIAQLNDKHLNPVWRDTAVPRTGDPDFEARIIEKMDRIAAAQPMSPSEVGFRMPEPGILQITRRVSMRKGHFWQLPKNINGQ